MEVPPPPPRRKKMKLSKDEKICGVCGDRALGCNFDAVSCESCKAFFRRNAFKDDMKCLFDGNCRIDVNTRRFCPFCRLKKCFDIGMRKELILGDEEKRKRLEKVVVNKDKKIKVPRQSTVSSSHTMSVSSPGPCDPTNLVSVMLCQKAHDEGLDPNLRRIVCDGNEVGRQLTPEESMILNKVLISYETSFMIDIDPPAGINRVNPDLNQLVNQSTVTVLKQIKFAKQMEDFSQLPQDVQIAMLKSSVVQVLFIRSVALYDESSDAWLTPKGVIPTTILKSGTGFEDMHKEHIIMCKAFKSLVQDDQMLISLMVLLTLFNPQGAAVSCKDLLANLQDKYLVLTKHYIEAKYSYAVANSMFTDLLLRMRDLRGISERHGRVLLDVNPMQVEPIMLEILDLK